jgi:membrane-associated phospholipid phosphatase
MPSLHFATSVMSARLLSETGRVPGTIGWAYAATLGVALVYLGEHYVVDLLAGLALAEGIRTGAPAAAPVAERVSAAIQALEARARG